MNPINDLPPIKAVVFFASQALKHHPETKTMEQAIRRGMSKAYDMYALDGEHDKASAVSELKVSEVLLQCRESVTNTTESEPGDSGDHYDSYRSAKQRRHNGLYH